MHHVIIGAGPAGVTAAETIRKQDPSADITLVGADRSYFPITRSPIT